MTGPIESFAPVKATRAFDEVIRQLRERIDSGQLRPGDRLPPERELATQFEVSRNTVREAFRMLEITGMIELRRGATGGAFICEGRSELVTQSLSDMMRLAAFSLSDLTEARLWLSSLVTRLACERADDEALAPLQANVDEAKAAAAAGDWTRVARVNIEFHNVLAELTGNPVLVIIQRSVMGTMAEISAALGPIRTDATVKSRVRILKHLRAGDADAAVREMERNLKRVHSLWLAEAGESTRGPEPSERGSTRW
ncbi:MAG: FadR family transcriptional regulator [Acidobacteria bacterium]|nr:FadR family transcriptional regulator [Acidobacteriota bacterium]